MRKPQLPGLTHLQFLVLAVLHGREQPGRVVRDALAAYGVRRSAAAFYQMMARLERDGLVDGYYGQVVVGASFLRIGRCCVVEATVVGCVRFSSRPTRICASRISNVLRRRDRGGRALCRRCAIAQRLSFC